MPNKGRMFYFQIRDHCPYGSLQDLLEQFNSFGGFKKESKEQLDAGKIVENTTA
jgi:hypothetical protein